MNFIRQILGVFVSLVDIIFKPRVKSLTDQEEAYLAKKLQGLELYQFKNCLFCVKVRWEMRRLGITTMPMKDAKNNSVSKAELLTGGGKVQVPCLKIQTASGKPKWLYESSDIIEYLNKNFS